jgi:transcriptional regulator with XRE-family HTH domain
LINKEIGQKIRQMRKHWGLSQMELAERMGISFQQIQKYEKGATSISVSRLQQISDALGIEITVFFMKETKGPVVRDVGMEYGPEGDSFKMTQPLTPEEIRLLKLFRKTKNKKVREGILQQLKGIIEMESQE